MINTQLVSAFATAFVWGLVLGLALGTITAGLLVGYLLSCTKRSPLPDLDALGGFVAEHKKLLRERRSEGLGHHPQCRCVVCQAAYDPSATEKCSYGTPDFARAPIQCAMNGCNESRWRVGESLCKKHWSDDRLSATVKVDVGSPDPESNA